MPIPMRADIADYYRHRDPESFAEALVASASTPTERLAATIWVTRGDITKAVAEAMAAALLTGRRSGPPP
jgi:hypothetical protein